METGILINATAERISLGEKPFDSHPQPCLDAILSFDSTGEVFVLVPRRFCKIYSVAVFQDLNSAFSGG